MFRRNSKTINSKRIRPCKLCLNAVCTCAESGYIGVIVKGGLLHDSTCGLDYRLDYRLDYELDYGLNYELDYGLNYELSSGQNF